MEIKMIWITFFVLKLENDQTSKFLRRILSTKCTINLTLSVFQLIVFTTQLNNEQRNKCINTRYLLFKHSNSKIRYTFREISGLWIYKRIWIKFLTFTLVNRLTGENADIRTSGKYQIKLDNRKIDLTLETLRSTISETYTYNQKKKTKIFSLHIEITNCNSFHN